MGRFFGRKKDEVPSVPTITVTDFGNVAEKQSMNSAISAGEEVRKNPSGDPGMDVAAMKTDGVVMGGGTSPATATTITATTDHQPDQPPTVETAENQSIQIEMMHGQDGTTSSATGPPGICRDFPVTRVAIDLILIIVFGIGMELIFRIIGPYRRGFFCDDETIGFPYKPNTVPPMLLWLFSIGVSGIVILAVEYFRLMNPETSDEHVSEFECGRSASSRLLIRYLYYKGYFAIAYVATSIFTSMAKFPVGRLRPHFLAVCRPNVTTADCLTLPIQSRYIENYVCQSEQLASIEEARLSFFSGHSSFSMCAAIFVMIYLQSRMRGLFASRMAVPLLQISILSIAMFISYSRIQDNMHHWSDVLIGMSVGSTVAAYVAITFAELDLSKMAVANRAFFSEIVRNSEKTTLIGNDHHRRNNGWPSNQSYQNPFSIRRRVGSMSPTEIV